jgi:branched-chain amino acid transport system permease protein
MLVIGGAGNLWGALFGAVALQVFEQVVSAANPFHWMTIVGVLLIAVVLFAPRGLTSLAASLAEGAWHSLRGKS